MNERNKATSVTNNFVMKATNGPPPKKPGSFVALCMTVEALVRRVIAVEQRPLARDGRDGAPGLNGKDADPQLIAQLVTAEVGRQIVQPVDGRDGRDGKDGRDGNDVDPAIVSQLVSDAVAKLPPPKDGLDGKDGRDGQDADPALISQMIADEVAKAVTNIQPAKDGRDGRDADPILIAQLVSDAVSRIPVPKDGRDGRDGLAGRSIVSGRIIDGSLVLTFTDGTTEQVGNVVGPQGAPGKDGLSIEGPPGKDGRNGIDGKNGTSIKGERGEPGRDGKDAAAPEVSIQFDDIGSANLTARDLDRLRLAEITLNGTTIQVVTLRHA